MNYLLRHSIDDNSKKGGWSPAPLTEEGKLLAEKTIKDIEKLNIKQIICSDLVRTKETCDIINNKLNLPVYYESKIREFNAGILSGMDYLTAEKLYPTKETDYLNMNFKYPKGETLGKFKTRILDYYFNIIKNTDKTLFITHRNVISVIYNELNNTIWNFNDKTTIKIPHCSLFELKNEKITKIN